jgi:hypothetical protein
MLVLVLVLVPVRPHCAFSCITGLAQDAHEREPQHRVLYCELRQAAGLHPPQRRQHAYVAVLERPHAGLGLLEADHDWLLLGMNPKMEHRIKRWKELGKCLLSAAAAPIMHFYSCNMHTPSRNCVSQLLSNNDVKDQ